jgi:hypothetical protein
MGVNECENINPAGRDTQPFINTRRITSLSVIKKEENWQTAGFLRQRDLNDHTPRLQWREA